MPTAERKEQLHDKNEKIKRTTRYFPKRNNLYKLLILKRKTNDTKCKLTLFCWEILTTKRRYQYLGLYTKFDHFLSKFKDQIKMIGNYYIYYNDQRFSFQKGSFRYITFCKKHCQINGFSVFCTWSLIMRKNVPTPKHEIWNIFYQFEQHV